MNARQQNRKVIFGNRKCMILPLGMFCIGHLSPLLASEINLEPIPHPATPKINFEYYCDNQNVVASIRHLNPLVPTADCCKDGQRGTWEGATTTYQWGGSASGTSPSASINLMAGTFGVSCTVSHEYKCSLTGALSGPQNDSPPSSASYTVKVNDSSNPQPAAPQPNASPINGADFKVTAIIDETIFPTQYRHRVNGTATQVMCNQSFIEDEAHRLESTVCGARNNKQTTTTKTWTAKVNLSILKVVQHPFAQALSVINQSYSETTSTTQYLYIFDPIDFHRRNIRVYKEIKSPISAVWGEGSHVLTESKKAGTSSVIYPLYTTALSGNVGVSGLASHDEDSINAYTAKEARIQCCPNQYDGN